MADEIRKFKSIPGCGIESSLLIDRLMQGRPGDIIADAELESICGHDCSPGGRGYGFLATARRKCLADGIVWQRIHKQGIIKCLEAREIIASAAVERKQITRKAKRITRKLGTVDHSALSETEKKSFFYNLSVSGAIASLGNTNTEKRLENQGATNRTMSPKETIALYLESFGGKKEQEDESEAE